nr:hypothetical protein B11C_110007 [Bartonella sp. 1-1C]
MKTSRNASNIEDVTTPQTFHNFIIDIRHALPILYTKDYYFIASYLLQKIFL